MADETDSAGAQAHAAGSPEAVRELFDLAELEPVSLTRFARVHRGRTAGGEPVLVKATDRRAEAMARWTRALATRGIPVVSPVRGPLEHAGEHWVVYPFIEGEVYAGRSGQIRSAGDLLGRLHASDAPTDGLGEYGHPGTRRAEVDKDLTGLREVFDAKLAPDAARQARAAVTALAERWWSRSWPLLKDRDEELPRCGVSSDFKASNLVFASRGPVLVDPDNGGVEPRLFDLAEALVLFHYESPGGSARMMAPHEWRTFVGAYSQHVSLTPAERELWPAAIDHLWWEEGTWVLADNDDAAWADPVQGGYLRSLALWDPARYRLPATEQGEST
ncbi:phosphotransferase enzyme family protein [Brachybacterium sp. NPDC056505]|uniref:phosphotransferase enzyme family protein n=1 Tax=Brachybacterium sp. NPDC056505 TaxID=3345843 RepID=UPI0036731F25